MKLNNSNGDKTQLKLWQNSKTQIVTKQKNPIVTTQTQLWQKSNCDKTETVYKLKLWPKLKLSQKLSFNKTQIVTQIKLWRKNFKKINATKLKLWQNWKYDKSQFIMKKKNILTP